MVKGQPKTRKNLPTGLRIGLVWSLILFLLAGSFYLVMAALQMGLPAEALPGIGDMATLLFGASSIALIIFSLLFAAVAVMGWQSLKAEVQKDIEENTEEEVRELEKELRGRVLTAIGFSIGTLHSSPDRMEQDEHKDYLSEAVYFCRAGYNILKNSKGMAGAMALNNLVYYSCLYGEDAKSDFLLKKAQELKAIGQEYSHPDSLLTFCRVILQYSSDLGELKEAQSIARSLLDTAQLTPRQKKEATFYVASLATKLVASPSTGTVKR